MTYMFYKPAGAGKNGIHIPKEIRVLTGTLFMVVKTESNNFHQEVNRLKV